VDKIKTPVHCVH